MERKSIDHQRRETKQPPWTSDPILSKYKFCNAYRVLDRTSQFVITELLEETFGGKLEYGAFDLDRYVKVLTAAVTRGEALFTGAYIKILPRVGVNRPGHVCHLELLQTLMHDLPAILDHPKCAADVYEKIAAYPGMGPFMTDQLMIILSYSPLLDLSANDFVVAGPGARSGLTKMFGESLSSARRAVPDIDATILRWMVTTQRTHFA
ncbi:hypothetical protein B0H14DRAFT_3767511 [Mycena olivaceomarginata]|nr:hypothetical protein B0H14DRAFT_3767511 [Mycena olivaceomarginata]